MNLTDRYIASNKNIQPIQYTGATRFNQDRSNLNIDASPVRYNTAGQLVSAGDTSNLNIDGTPVRYNP